MQPRIYWFVACTAVIFIGCNAVASNEKELGGKEKSSTYNSSPTDDIYLEDQDALEGSGRGGGEVRDDLESSGSGLGPDDEDGDDGEFSTNNIHRPVDQPPKPSEPKTPYIEDPHKTKDNSIQDLAPPNRVDSDIHDLDSGHSDSDPIKDDDIETPYMNPKQEDRSGSFFAQPGVLAAVIGGAVVGLLCAILVVMFIVYRMRKKDEGSYALDEPRRSPATAAYPKAGAPHHNREFYA